MTTKVLLLSRLCDICDRARAKRFHFFQPQNDLVQTFQLGMLWDANTFKHSGDLAISPRLQKGPLTKLRPLNTCKNHRHPLVMVLLQLGPESCELVTV